MRILFFNIVMVCLFAASGFTEDKLEVIKHNLSEADCANFDFMAIVKSDVFESVDTSYGSAYVANDGRYLISIGKDEYLFDLDHLFSYSFENNQVTVEKAANKNYEEEILFITNLDKFYNTYRVHPDREYRLIKLTEETNDAIPDSLRLFLDSTSSMIERLEFYDINGDLNQLLFQNQVLTDSCDVTRFEPNFPDSVETVKLF